MLIPVKGAWIDTDRGTVRNEHSLGMFTVGAVELITSITAIVHEVTLYIAGQTHIVLASEEIQTETLVF